MDFPDREDLTCFGDYKLPQALRHLGPLEVEIRAPTVVAVERLRDGLEQRGRRLRAFEVDWVLWSYA